LRRRRRRSGFGQHRSNRSLFAWGAIAVVLIGGFLFFMRQADVLAPQQREVRIDLPGAFKE
jgi:hypothetical protein